MPKSTYMYAVPREFYEKYGVRKYGAHGTSHRYIGEKVAEVLGKDPKDITPDYTLDTLGEPCPYPAIVMLETMPQLQKGEILELLK